MRKEDKEATAGYPAAIAIGFFIGMIGGVGGMLFAEGAGFGRADSVYLTGGFGGLCVALFMNKVLRAKIDDYESKLKWLKEDYQERIAELKRSN